MKIKIYTGILLFTFALAMGLSPTYTNAYFFDLETSEENSFSASSLDIELDAEQTATSTREVEVENNGEMNFEYTIETTVQNSTSTDFCADLDMVVTRENNEIYDDALKDFSATSSLLTVDDTEDLVFEFSVENKDVTYTGDCLVTFKYEANQPGFSYGEAFYDGETDEITLHGSDFGEPDDDPEPEPESGQVIINEIMYDPGEFEGSEADNDREWIEIYNGSNTVINLTGWIFHESETNHGIHSFDGSHQVAPGEYAIIADDATTFAAEHSDVNVPIFDSSFTLPNNLTPQNPNLLKLIDDTSTVIDTEDYPPSNGANDNGHSLQLNTGGNLCAAPATPGQPNTCGGNSGNPNNGQKNQTMNFMMSFEPQVQGSETKEEKKKEEQEEDDSESEGEEKGSESEEENAENEKENDPSNTSGEADEELEGESSDTSEEEGEEEDNSIESPAASSSPEDELNEVNETEI